jgi:dehydrodolichyl diphosphate syntase complex subunit NUS1
MHTDILPGDNGVPAPDLVIVHHCSPAKRSRSPLELHGFPPWQIRLSEIQWAHSSLVRYPIHPVFSHDEYAATYWRWLMPWRRRQVVTLSEAKFRLALDDYASAEMRLGK